MGKKKKSTKDIPTTELARIVVLCIDELVWAVTALRRQGNRIFENPSDPTVSRARVTKKRKQR